MSNYANILELLLRLRQACDHPFLTYKLNSNNNNNNSNNNNNNNNNTSSNIASHTFADIDELLAKFLTHTPGLSKAYVSSVLDTLKGLLLLVLLLL